MSIWMKKSNLVVSGKSNVEPGGARIANTVLPQKQNMLPI